MTKEAKTSNFGLGMLLFATVAMLGCSTPYLNYQIQADETLNADTAGFSYSVIVRIYQLSDTDTFLTADYNDLFHAGPELFGGALLAQHELTIEPGQAYRVSFLKQDVTRYTGVVAFFRDREENHWRALRKVNNGPIPASTALRLNIVNNQVKLDYAL